MLRCLLLASLLGAVAYAGLVKRDTIDDLKESVNSMFDSNNNPLEDLQGGNKCLTDSQCLEPVQYCNRENPLNPHCEYKVQEGAFCLTDSQCLEPVQFCNKDNLLNPHCQYVIWVWVGLGVVGAVLLLTIFGSCFCCSCCCLHGLCRKK